MNNSAANLRKAAVLLRSVDAETAGTLLAQLSTEEAAALREAVRGLGPLDPDEQAHVLAAFRDGRPVATPTVNQGVELALSSAGNSIADSPAKSSNFDGKRFEFLESASASTVASYLAREHAQTIAVVLSHVQPDRAAAVLAELPEKLQAEVMQRLSDLGDTDAEIVNVLESELAAWLKRRGNETDSRSGRSTAATSILAAADSKTREAILANLNSHNARLAAHTQAFKGEQSRASRTHHIDEYRVVRSMAKRHLVNSQLRSLTSPQDALNSVATPPSATCAPARPAPSQPALPRIDFDNLVHLDSQMLAQLLASADSNLLALALAGSSDDLVERICDQMPRQMAKAFRRELRRMAPTRLSDVEDAQRSIAELAREADRKKVD